MKKLVVFLIVSMISVLSFAGCTYFQLANDCNGNSTTLIAKNGLASVDIHANWNQGNVLCKFQSGPEKLDMTVYANDMTRLYTEITYKNKSAKIYYDFNLGQMNTENVASLQTLWQSINPSFLANIELLLADLPEGTSNLNLLGNLTLALVSHDSSPAHTNFAFPWDYAAYSICYAARMAGGEDSGTAESTCFHKYIAKDWNG